jgi:cytochrome c5
MTDRPRSSRSFARGFWAGLVLSGIACLIIYLVTPGSGPTHREATAEQLHKDHTATLARVARVGGNAASEISDRENASDEIPAPDTITLDPGLVDSADSTREEEATGPTQSGEQVYNQSCLLCHATGIAGAPALNDDKNWAPRMLQGREILYQHAIEGYTGVSGFMPAKGGNLTLSDEDVRAAVDFMTINR